MSNNFEFECGCGGILNKYMCLDLINDTKKELIPWKYNFIINSIIIVLFFAVFIWRMINHTATEKNVCYLTIMCIGVMISCVAFANFFKNYKQNKKLFKLIRRLRQHGGGHLYDIDFHDSFVIAMVPICNYIEKILHKKVSPYKYRYQIIAITKNNGETTYYAVVKKYISSIREYIHPVSDTIYTSTNEMFRYDTYAEAKHAIDVFKTEVLKTYEEQEAKRKKKEENARLKRKKQKQADLQRKQEMKKEKHNQQVKRKVIIDC